MKKKITYPDEPTIAELKEVADNKGLGMSTLVRMW